MTRPWPIVSFLLAAGGLGAAACGHESRPAAGAGGAGGARGAVRFPVEVEVVATQPVEYSVSAVGSVEAFEIVEVTARVAGAVEEVRFLEGDLVRAGQVLAEIEPERYRLGVDTARALLARAAAEKAEADAGLARRQSVSADKPGLIPGEELETWRTRVATAAAQVDQAKTALDRAEMDSRYASVAAPMAGVMQTRSLRTGQYVQPGTVLGTLVRREPLLLRFSVSEREAASLRNGMVARFRTRGGSMDHHARIKHVADVADASSRMVAVTAEVELQSAATARGAAGGPDDAVASLRPGAFAEVVVPIESRGESPVIPQTAVRPTERGFVSFVIEDGKASERLLTLGLRTAAGGVEVRSGLERGDSLVTRGAEALREGALVRVSESGDTPSDAAKANAAGAGGAR